MGQWLRLPVGSLGREFGNTGMAYTYAFSSIPGSNSIYKLMFIVHNDVFLHTLFLYMWFISDVGLSWLNWISTWLVWWLMNLIMIAWLLFAWNFGTVSLTSLKTVGHFYFSWLLLLLMLSLEALRKETWPTLTSIQEKLYGPAEELRKTTHFIQRTGLQV